MIVDISYLGMNAKLSDGDVNDHIIRSISRTNMFYEKELIDELFHRAMPDWYFVDLGAHIGNHTVFLGKILQLNGIAIEANPGTYKKLQRNLEINELGRRVKALNVSIGAKIGKAIVLKSKIPNNSGAATSRLDPNGDVDQITLDSLQLKKVDFVKIDIEGSEMECLEGARTTLLRYKPLLCVEIISLEGFERIREWLGALGYRPVRRFNHTPTYIFEA